MELYLDSVDFKEIQDASSLGIITGLTTTPTFMHRQGVTDIDGTILKLATMVDILQVEALGTKADEIVGEAHRQLDMGLTKEKSVFKIPVSNEGIKAARMLSNEGIKTNVHLVYTLQQAYMAMLAGATYICPLAGRLQDQGHDALALFEQCVDATERFGYESKIMFSSVRHVEHVRNAINIGVHACTVPWSVMKKLTENNLTQLGTDQFIEHTRLLTIKVEEVIRKANPIVKPTDSVLDAVMVMSASGLGAATRVDDKGNVVGIFTDGDLRRLIQSEGKDVLGKAIGGFPAKEPLTVASEALLYVAVDLIKKNSVDNLIVTEGGKPVGMLDVQDLVKMNLM